MWFSTIIHLWPILTAKMSPYVLVNSLNLMCGLSIKPDEKAWIWRHQYWNNDQAIFKIMSYQQCVKNNMRGFCIRVYTKLMWTHGVAKTEAKMGFWRRLNISPPSFAELSKCIGWIIICDAIFRNQSEYMWHFQFSILLKSSLGEVHVAENPHLNRTSGSKIIAIERFSKQ